MLTLPIKGKWFDMIVAKEKKEEYRDIKPYYTKRFETIGLLDQDGNPTDKACPIILKMDMRKMQGRHRLLLICGLEQGIQTGVP